VKRVIYFTIKSLCTSISDDQAKTHTILDHQIYIENGITILLYFASVFFLFFRLGYVPYIIILLIFFYRTLKLEYA